MIGKKYKDINAAQQFSRQLNTKDRCMFPFMQRMFDHLYQDTKKRIYENT